MSFHVDRATPASNNNTCFFNNVKRRVISYQLIFLFCGIKTKYSLSYSSLLQGTIQVDFPRVKMLLQRFLSSDSVTRTLVSNVTIAGTKIIPLQTTQHQILLGSITIQNSSNISQPQNTFHKTIKEKCLCISGLFVYL